MSGKIGSLWLTFEYCELGNIEVSMGVNLVGSGQNEGIGQGVGRVTIVWPGNWNPWWISNSCGEM